MKMVRQAIYAGGRECKDRGQLSSAGQLSDQQVVPKATELARQGAAHIYGQDRGRCPPPRAMQTQLEIFIIGILTLLPT
jgi:hypothetical protein